MTLLLNQQLINITVSEVNRFGKLVIVLMDSTFKNHLISDGCHSKTSIIPSHSGRQHLKFVIEWPETNIGGLVVDSCPCGDILLEGQLQATRYCGGDFTNGALWDTADVSRCNFSDLAREICQLRDVINYIILTSN